MVTRSSGLGSCGDSTAKPLYSTKRLTEICCSSFKVLQTCSVEINQYGTDTKLECGIPISLLKSMGNGAFPMASFRIPWEKLIHTEFPQGFLNSHAQLLMGISWAAFVIDFKQKSTGSTGNTKVFVKTKTPLCVSIFLGWVGVADRVS